MAQPNGQQPVHIPVPLLGKQQLAHYHVRIVVDGQEVELDYLVSGYALDQNGCLLFVTNQQPVAVYAPGTWRAVWRADVVPTVLAS